MGLRDRLKRLEARTTPRRPAGFPQRNLEQYFALLEHDRGVGPAPRPQPYTEEDYREDMTVIGWLRSDPGWDTPLGHRFLDEWEQASKESLEKGRQA